jgi:hypothetical protein
MFRARPPVQRRVGGKQGKLAVRRILPLIILPPLYFRAMKKVLVFLLMLGVGALVG